MADFFEEQIQKEEAQANQYANLYLQHYREMRDRNTQRYNDKIARLQEQRDRTMERLSMFGEQGLADIRQSFVNLESNSLQGIVNSGLGNTTVYNAAQSDIQQRRSAELARAEQSIADNRLNAELGYEEALLGMEERRDNSFAASDELVRLGALLGRSQGGAGQSSIYAGDPNLGDAYGDYLQRTYSLDSYTSWEGYSGLWKSYAQLYDSAYDTVKGWFD